MATRISHLRGAVLFALALPLSVGFALIAPQTVSVAQGCTGGSAEAWSHLPAGWHYVTADASAGATLPANAVFVLRGRLRGLDESAALATANVEVKDGTGAVVTGSLALIDRLAIEVGLADLRSAALVWRPAAPLTPGEKYAVSWNVDGMSGSGELVVGATSEAPTPAQVDSFAYAEVTALSGPYVQCAVPANCGTGTIQLTFHASTTREQGVSAVIQPGASAANASYQLFELGAVPGKGTLAGLPRRALSIASAAAVANKHALSAAFSDALPEYCVRLVATDLRTGDTTQSDPLCVLSSGTPADAAEWWEGAIAMCVEPPPAELRDVWCEHHENALSCGGPGEGGSSGAGGGSSAGNAGSSAKPDSASSDCACAAPGRSSSDAFWLGVVVLGGLAVGLRRLGPG